MVLIIAAMLLLTAASEPPAPSSGELRSPQKSQASEQQEQSKADQRGTDAAPIVVKIAPAPDAQKKAEEAERQEDIKAAADHRAEVTTDIIAGATAIQAIALIWTIIVMVGGNKRQLRAYVGIDEIKVEAPNLKHASYEVPDTIPSDFIWKDFVVTTSKNYGVTPAHDICVNVSWQEMVPFGSFLPKNFPYADYNTAANPEYASKFILDPGKVHVGHSRIDKLRFFRDAAAKRTNLYIYGHIDYTDIYNRRWRRDFCYWYEPWRPVGDQFVPYWYHHSDYRI